MLEGEKNKTGSGEVILDMHVGSLRTSAMSRAVSQAATSGLESADHQGNARVAGGRGGRARPCSDDDSWQSNPAMGLNREGSPRRSSQAVKVHRSSKL